MELNEYQEKAMTTCLPTCENFSYMMLNLVGEVGEFASKMAKGIRKSDISINPTTGDAVAFAPYDKGYEEETEKLLEGLQKEAGDILWQLSGLCHVMGWRLEEIAQMNLDKLASRKKRGVIDGEGDNR